MGVPVEVLGEQCDQFIAPPVHVPGHVRGHDQEGDPVHPRAGGVHQPSASAAGQAGRTASEMKSQASSTPASLAQRASGVCCASYSVTASCTAFRAASGNAPVWSAVIASGEGLVR